LFWRFVAENIAENPDRLRLRYAGKDLGFDVALAITQIDCRRRVRHKLSATLAAAPHFLFPHTLSAEQCTSETVALLHAAEVPDGAKVLDMTCGLGIDAMAIASKASSVTALEIDPDTVAAVRHNLIELGIRNIEVIEADSSRWIGECRERFDLIFIDPARRSEYNRRLFSLQDCHPNLLELLPQMLEIAPKVVAKCSPMLDVTQLLQSVPGVEKLQIISLKGECKEIVLHIVRDANQTRIEAKNGEDNTVRLAYTSDDIRNESIRYLNGPVREGMWLIEPDAAVMKTGVWGVLCGRYPSIRKLSANTQLFVSEEEPEDFPGRCVRIQSLLTGKEAKVLLKGRRLNVVCRNYPLTTEQLKKKYGIKDGSDQYLYAFSSCGSTPCIALCQQPPQIIPDC